MKCFFDSRLPEEWFNNAVKAWKQRKKYWFKIKNKSSSPEILKILWLEENPKPPTLLEVMGTSWNSYSEEVRAKMINTGSASELATLNYIINDISELLQIKKTPKREFKAINLLRSITMLWTGGINRSHNAEREKYHKKMRRINPNCDPRREELYRYAMLLYEYYNNEAICLRNWVEKNRREDILIRGKNIMIRKGLKDEDLSSMLEKTKQISYTEALKRANQPTFFNNSTFSNEEFDKMKIELENGFKEWRNTHKT